jgi:RimJ/RimL family protein N-acetyltransferase
MKFKPGQFIEEFEAKDGKKIIFRTPKPSDLFQLLHFINSLIEEDTFILTCKKRTIKEEKEYMRKILKSMKEGKGVWVVALHNEKIVAHGSVHVSGERSPHVCELSISVLKPYRNLGIGKKLIDLLINFGKTLNFKYIILGVFANNKIAIKLYKKFGFKQVARIPKIFLYKGKYVDDIWMMKKIKS